MTTQLTVIERAAVALGASQHEANLRELVKASTGITAVINADGRTEAHRAAMTLRNARTGIDKAGKDARDDANAFARAVIAEAKRLADITEPEEKRLLALRDEWDAKIEAEKQAKIEAEKERVAGIQKLVASIRAVPLSFAATDAATLAEAIEETMASVIDEANFAEFVPHASSAKEEAIKSLQLLHSQAVEREAEVARIKAEQEAAAARLAEEKADLERLRSEAAERERKQKAQRDADAAKEQAERKAEAEKMAKAQAAAKADQDRIAAEFAAERAKLDAERKAFEKAQAAERAAKDAAERAEREKAEVVERQAKAVAAAEESARAKAAEVKPIPEPASPIPSADEIITLLAGHYKVSDQVAQGWLQRIDFTSLTAAAA